MDRRSLSACAAICALTATPAVAEGWSLAAGLEYSSGDYGLADDTTIVRAPLTVAYGGDGWGVSLTIPYVHVEGPGGIAPGGTGAASGGLLGLLGAGDAAEAQAAGPVDEEGLGDIVAAASLTPFESEDGRSALSLIGRVSAPTGDEDRSLGIGESAASLAVAAHHALGEVAEFYGGLGYERAFESEADGLFAAAGAEWRLTARWRAGARVDWAEASSSLRRDATQASLYAGVDIGDRARVVVYGSAGLSDTSPDAAGVGVVLTP